MVSLSKFPMGRSKHKGSKFSLGSTLKNIIQGIFYYMALEEVQDEAEKFKGTSMVMPGPYISQESRGSPRTLKGTTTSNKFEHFLRIPNKSDRQAKTIKEFGFQHFEGHVLNNSWPPSPLEQQPSTHASSFGLRDSSLRSVLKESPLLINVCNNSYLSHLSVFHLLSLILRWPLWRHNGLDLLQTKRRHVACEQRDVCQERRVD